MYENTECCGILLHPGRESKTCPIYHCTGNRFFHRHTTPRHRPDREYSFRVRNLNLHRFCDQYSPLPFSNHTPRPLLQIRHVSIFSLAPDARLPYVERYIQEMFWLCGKSLCRRQSTLRLARVAKSLVTRVEHFGNTLFFYKNQ